MRYSAIVALLSASAIGQAADLPDKPISTPTVELDREVHGSSRGFIVVTAKTNGPVVHWVALDPGLTLIPPQLLRDSKTAVLMAEKAGRYRLLAYTALADSPSPPTITTIIVDAASPAPSNPPTPDTAIWAVVIQPDGPLSRDLAANRKHPAWARLKGRGVKLSWIEWSNVDPSYSNDLLGLAPPILLVLKVRTVKGKPVSTVVSRQSLPAAEVAERLVMEALP